jgi:hypothetical protein
VLLAAASVAGGIALVAGEGGGSRSGSRFSGQPRSRPSGATRSQQASVHGNAWRAYETTVVPGGRLQFASIEVGYALSWAPTNGFDDNLSSPGGLILNWPSPSVLVTRDSGRHWRRSLSAPGGFWGVSVVSPSQAWAVGVTRLYRTLDGGQSWRRVGEPTKPLVRVAFANTTTGVGLTTKGRLVVSSDGGSSWLPASWSGRGSALCASPSGAILLANQVGAIWRSGNGGETWQQTARGFRHIDQFYGWPTDISCRGSNVVEFSQAFCAAACGGGQLARVRQSTDGGRTWRLIAGHQGAPYRLDTKASASSSTWTLVQAVPLGTGGVCLVPYPYARAALVISCRASPRTRFRRAIVPSLPFGSSPSPVVVQSLDFLTGRTGWIEVDKLNSAQMPRTEAKTEVWMTDDGGLTWHVAYATPGYYGACRTNPRGRFCWRPRLS